MPILGLKIRFSIFNKKIFKSKIRNPRPFEFTCVIIYITFVALRKLYKNLKKTIHFFQQIW